MTAIKLAEIEHDLAGFPRRIEAGESLLILREDRPVAEVRPINGVSNISLESRPFGLAAGEFEVTDKFFEPLPEEILRDFEGR